MDDDITEEVEAELPLEEGQTRFFPRTLQGQQVLVHLLEENDNNLEATLVDAAERIAAYELTVSRGFHRNTLPPVISPSEDGGQDQ